MGRDEGRTPGDGGTDEGATDRSAHQSAEDVAETGTALEPGERNSALDLEDAPGTAGPGAGG